MKTKYYIFVLVFVSTEVQSCWKTPSQYKHTTPSSDTTISSADTTLGVSISEGEPKAIIVAGGLPSSSYRSVEALNADGSPLCTLRNLPDDRWAHTMAEGGQLCGGGRGDTKKSCIHYDNDRWKTFNWRLQKPRDSHVQWETKNVRLMGGRDSGGTSEVVNVNSTEPGFPLKRSTAAACAIQVDKYLYLTGGFSLAEKSEKTFIKYNEHGPMDEELPLLNHPRSYHACGFFHSNNELVIVVAGGHGTGRNNHLSSTEIWRNFSPMWEIVDGGDLPTPRAGLSALSINNKIILTGGTDEYEYYSDILELEAETGSFQWKKIGKMQKERVWHSMSLLALDKVKCLY